MPESAVDVVVVGSGPNGLTAAVLAAQAGLRVRVYESAAEIGGGTRTQELTLPGFRHDICSAIHPLGIGSPVFRRMPLEQFGLEWIHSPLALAHPLPELPPALLARSISETAASLGADAQSYEKLISPFAGKWWQLAPDALRPILSMPRHPLLLARFGMQGIKPASMLLSRFTQPHARALFAGLAGHAIATPRSLATAGVGLMFAIAGHDVGWPFPRGGSSAISQALSAYLKTLGGEIVTDHPVEDLRDLPRASAFFLDVAPWNVGKIAGGRLPEPYLRRLSHTKHGPGIFKIDYALSAPVPWRDDECGRAATVHLGASENEIEAALTDVTHGRLPEKPFLITAQPSRFDQSRAPEGKHTFWVYAHVPNGWRGDMTTAIERQIERFAPGFRDVVLARNVAPPQELERRNANDVGGDIGVGAFGGYRAFFRPIITPVPYATPDPAIYLCSAATPPGPGVHGMCGYHAARYALRRVFGKRVSL